MRSSFLWTSLALIVFVFVSACSVHPAVQASTFIDLDNLQPLPTPDNQSVTPLRVAIAAVISPQGSAESYSLLLDYLSKKIDRPVERVQRQTYSEVNELLRSGEVDMAFVCTSSYLIGQREFDLQLLAIPQVQGKTSYRANIIVPSNSSARGIEDLRGTVFAFTDPTSFTGHIYPTYLLMQSGENPEDFFSRTFFTYSHDDAIYAVAHGVADGASVDNLVLDFAIKRDPELEQKIRIIHTSEPFGMPPVVVRPDIRPQLFANLQDVLLNIHLDPEGRAALDTLGYDRFLPPDESSYETARDIESAVKCCTSSNP